MKFIYLVCLLLFGIVILNVVHETVHLIQAKGNYEEFCFIGDNKLGVGWVASYALDGENLELPAYILSFVVVAMYYAGVVYNYLN